MKNILKFESAPLRGLSVYLLEMTKHSLLSKGGRSSVPAACIVCREQQNNHQNLCTRCVSRLKKIMSSSEGSIDGGLALALRTGRSLRREQTVRKWARTLVKSDVKIRATLKDAMKQNKTLRRVIQY